MAYKRIDQYGLIGDMSSAALVGTDGSIDWCYFPRFDSPSVFAAILDDKKGGSFQIAPAAHAERTQQAYLPDTNILETTFDTPTGQLTLIDFMLVQSPGSNGNRAHEIHRIVRCTAGEVEVRCDFQPRLDYSLAKTALARTKSGALAHGNHQRLTLCSQVPLEIKGGNARSQFTLRREEEVVFVLAYGHRCPQKLESYHTHQKLDYTITMLIGRLLRQDKSLVVNIRG